MSDVVDLLFDDILLGFLYKRIEALLASLIAEAAIILAAIPFTCQGLCLVPFCTDEAPTAMKFYLFQPAGRQEQTGRVDGASLACARCSSSTSGCSVF